MFLNTTLARRVVATAAAAGLATAAGAQQYSIVDMGTLGGPVSAGFAVNDLGHAAGAATLVGAAYHGLYWNGSAGAGVAPLAGDSQCWAFGVDGADRVVAMSYTLGAATTHGVMWQNGVGTALGGLAPRGISSSGLVAGFITVSDAEVGAADHAAVWTQGVVTDLGTLGGKTSYAAGVNAAGQVAGWSFAAGNLNVRAALWQGGAALDLGTLGGARSQAYAISNAGGVAGWGLTAAGEAHAMLLQVDAAGVVTQRRDLGVLAGGYSYAYGVNNALDVVGTSGSRAFLWRAGSMVDLNTRVAPGSGWVLERAWAISDSGVIVGTGLHQGFARGFVLVPACYANCDNSSTPPILNVNDFVCFQQKFAAGDPYANCDGSTIQPVLNVNDFVCFLSRFAGGCE